MLTHRINHIFVFILLPTSFDHKVPDLVGCLVGGCPVRSRVGPGAKIGHYFEQTAKGIKKPRVATDLPYIEQTEKCEFSKLICRMNFPEAREDARYIPST